MRHIPALAMILPSARSYRRLRTSNLLRIFGNTLAILRAVMTALPIAATTRFRLGSPNLKVFVGNCVKCGLVGGVEMYSWDCVLG